MLAEVLLTESPRSGEYSPFNKAASTSPVLNTGKKSVYFLFLFSKNLRNNKSLCINSDPGNTMLGIVQAQRERLRQQKEELEIRTEQQEQQLQLLQGEVQHLQQDNVKVGD
jgi:hypothetical protein